MLALITESDDCFLLPKDSNLAANTVIAIGSYYETFTSTMNRIISTRLPHLVCLYTLYLEHISINRAIVRKLQIHFNFTKFTKVGREHKVRKKCNANGIRLIGESHLHLHTAISVRD